MKANRVTAAALALLALAPLSALAQKDQSISRARSLTNFGVDAVAKGLWSEAVFRWQQAVEIFPNFPAAHNNLGVAYEHYGKYNLARNHFNIAMELSRGNRFVESNNRMFRQFYSQYIQKSRKELNHNQDDAKDAGEQSSEGENSSLSVESAATGTSATAADRLVVSDKALSEGRESAPADEVRIIGPTYSKVGSSLQIFIKHPKRSTPLSGKYRRVYIAGFAPLAAETANLNFETTEYFRSELRKFSLYEIIPLEALSLPADEDKIDELIDDDEFWRRLGERVGADLIIYGMVRFYSEPADGFFPYEYRDRRTGRYRTVQMTIERTAFTVELDMFFQETATGKLVYQESYGQTIVFRGRLGLTIQAFYDVMNRILPRFMDVLVPREHDAIRFVLNG